MTLHDDSIGADFKGFPVLIVIEGKPRVTFPPSRLRNKRFCIGFAHECPIARMLMGPSGSHYRRSRSISWRKVNYAATKRQKSLNRHPSRQRQLHPLGPRRPRAVRKAPTPGKNNGACHLRIGSMQGRFGARFHGCCRNGWLTGLDPDARRTG